MFAAAAAGISSGLLSVDAEVGTEVAKCVFSSAASCGSFKNAVALDVLCCLLKERIKYRIPTHPLSLNHTTQVNR